METKPWHRHYDYNVPTTMRYPRIPAQNIFHVAASQFPKKPALTIYGSEITFSQLREQALRLSNALVGLGIKKGDRVGIDVKPGEPGEILLKSPTIMQGYWKNPEETANQIKDGWLHTGDIAQTDEDGYFYIVDRKKDMIIAGGFNIYPREIDEVLYQNPKVHEAVSVGIPDSYRGETVKTFVVLKPGASATEKEIIEFCKIKLAPYKVPKQVEFKDALPKSAVGKILRKIMRDEEVAKHKKQ